MPADLAAPHVKGPPLSCDCHLHVFGDPVTYIDEHAPDAELARLAAAGVVGIRFNLGPPNRPREAGLMEKHLARLLRLDARCAEIGWQLDILSPSWLIIDMLEVYRKFKSNFTRAHFGRFVHIY